MTETVDSLKQRLVGAFVIVTLAIIFLPMIFDKPHQQDSIVVVPVPPKPEFKTIEITKPISPSFQAVKENAKTGKVEEYQSSNVVKRDSKEDLDNSKTDVIESDDSVLKKSKKIADLKNKEVTVKSKETKIKSKPIVKNLSVFKDVWMVQLGTFGSVKNAYNLRDKLRKDGFDGHTRTITLNGKKAVKVFSGPFVKKRDAIKIKKRLDSKYKVDSRVVFF